MKKSAIAIAILIVFAYFYFIINEAHAITTLPLWSGSYSAPMISSGTYGQVTVGSQTAVAVPSSRMQCRGAISYANQSSSDTVFQIVATSTPSVVNVPSTGFPMLPTDKISIAVNPLYPYATFYFQAQAGSTGVDLRWEELGCTGGN